MKKILVGIMFMAALSFVAYTTYAHCGKCGTSCPKTTAQSSQPACKMQAQNPACGMKGGCGCCDKCACGNCSMKDSKPCCDKCACGNCGMKDGKGCAMMKDGKCPDNCTCKNCACKTAAATADPTKQDIAPDPVCGMDVTTKDAKYSYEYKGKTYYFCSESCKDRFSKDPSKYLGE